MGKPATRSIIETKMAIPKDAEIAFIALDIKPESSKTCPIKFHLRRIPKIGGTKINAKKKMTEDE